MGKIRDTRRRLAYREVAKGLKAEMEALRKRGLTLDEIGKLHGVTKQRVHQILSEA